MNTIKQNSMDKEIFNKDSVTKFLLDKVNGFVKLELHFQEENDYDYEYGCNGEVWDSADKPTEVFSLYGTDKILEYFKFQRDTTEQPYENLFYGVVLASNGTIYELSREDGSNKFKLDVSYRDERLRLNNLIESFEKGK